MQIGISTGLLRLRGAGGAASDPTFSNTSLLLLGDGANGGTVFTDSSPNANTVVREGNTQISTAQAKFGSSSIFFDGTGDVLKVTSNPTLFAPGTGDFTVELFIRFNAAPASQFIFDQRYGATAGRLGLYVNAGGKFAPLNGGAELFAGTLSPTSGVWYHIAICRSGTSLRMFVDGVQDGITVTNSTNFTADTLEPFALGRNGFNLTGNLHAWVEQVRFKKGVALYTTNFTPPTSPFPAT